MSSANGGHYLSASKWWNESLLEPGMTRITDTLILHQAPLSETAYSNIQIHFLERKDLYFDDDFTAVCSLGSN